MTEIANVPRCTKTYDPKREAEALAADYRATEAIDTMLARGHIRPEPERDSLGTMALIAVAALLVLIATLFAAGSRAREALLGAQSRGLGVMMERIAA